MTWFRRGRGGATAGAATGAAPGSLGGDPSDHPEALGRAVDDLDRYINSQAGRLPGAAVVNARRLTDTLRDIVATSQSRPLDVYALVSVRGTLDDYLPTTLRTYLAAADPEQPAPSPTQSLLEQIEVLQSSASATLAAAHSQDADALMTQGRFLQSKFAGSELDL